MRLLLFFSLVGALSVSSVGCKTTSRSSTGGGGSADAYDVEKTVVEVRGANGERLAQLGADHYLARDNARRTTVVMVPGAGRVSRQGERSGNGSRDYEAPIAFTEAFAVDLAKAGFNVLAYDKRTCTPADNALCQTNDKSDIDAEGPGAMAKDVDAACALAEAKGDGVVLFAHGQAAQTALLSQCAQSKAVAIVLVAPMPAAVDKVIVRGLTRRAALLREWGDKEVRSEKTKAAGEEKIAEALALKNKAADLADTFALLRAEKFAADARVLGATPAFWRGWMDLTENTPALLGATQAPVLVVLGQWDSQYAPEDKRKIEQMATTPADFVVIDKGDHYLMVDLADHPAGRAAVIERLVERLQAVGPTS